MVADVEPNTSSSLERLPRWKARQASCQGLARSHPSSPSAVPRCAASDLNLDDLLRGGGCSAELYQEDVDRDEPDTMSTLSDSPVDGPLFTFTPQKTATSFKFSVRPHPGPQVCKRFRPRQDVDGPHTAALSCKKRRLRSDLITSRLSQPYSQPATHILNREGIKAGDKRFLKMATSLDVARRIAHLHATSFLRFSVMNRLRRRLGLGQPGQHYDDEDEEEQADKGKLDTTSKAPWKPQTLEGTSCGKYIRPSRDASATASGHSSKSQACRLSKPAALPLPPADVLAARRRTLSRIHPIRSPEMRPEHGAYDELDDDPFAFPHLDEEVGDGNGSEHVYSDFSVIFGGGASDDDQSYEEYLDELDGISWVTM